MWKIGLAVTALLLATLACGPPPPTPTPIPPAVSTAIPTWTLPFASPTIVERVTTLTPKPSATAGPSQTRPYTPTTRLTATQTRPAAFTRAPAPATPLPTPAPALPTDTPAPVIVPTETPVPAPTNYDRNG